ncbi:hypothetical protein G3N55_04260 [Dissulfurirhabdus thermomarina]|uniref:DUF4398 domain-containing protein n=1 Tax=Dissulfurirhabdus thermomarina TaxID=1765737 RepID=A0A6N9TLA9_DISTH|nr:hypothetical protein [Dissulfurirhabdus thermomarina]NDY42062.1 hypothetical protein [Dissulfurirhabdus thermomarina]NMX24536.1 hypothetical protein [Dissulfurirhabdus thermomarina]
MASLPRCTRCGLAPAALLLCLVLPLSGFTLASGRQLQKEIQEKLERIREMSPGVQAMEDWRRARREAEAAVEAAREGGARRYAADGLAEAEDLLALAKDYAWKKAYRKAAYLARTAGAKAKAAQEAAAAARKTLRDRALEEIRALAERLEGLAARVPARGPLAKEYAELRLAVADLRHAVALEQFDEVHPAVVRLRARIHRFSRRL